MSSFDIFKIENAEIEKLSLEQRILEIKTKLERMEKRLANLNDSNHNKIADKEFVFENNPELRFFAEVYPNGGDFQASDIYSNYVKWAEKENLSPKSSTVFGITLTKHYGFIKRRKQPGNYYLIPPIKHFDLDQFLNEI